MLDGLVMATVMIVTTTVDADGIVVTAVAMPITTTTVMMVTITQDVTGMTVIVVNLPV
jgi:hypothetical protein